jgi:hypothetical protein
MQNSVTLVLSHLPLTAHAASLSTEGEIDPWTALQASTAAPGAAATCPSPWSLPRSLAVAARQTGLCSPLDIAPRGKPRQACNGVVGDS